MRRSRETGSEPTGAGSETSGQHFGTAADDETSPLVQSVIISPSNMQHSGRTAEQRMWEYYVGERARPHANGR